MLYQRLHFFFIKCYISIFAMHVYLASFIEIGRNIMAERISLSHPLFYTIEKLALFPLLSDLVVKISSPSSPTA